MHGNIKKRKQVEDTILTYVKKITNDDRNVQLYKDLFKRLNNEEFDNWMLDLKNKKATLTIIAPNGEDNGISKDNNIKIAKELGYDFFQHLIITKKDGTQYKTPIKFFVVKLPIRRFQQILAKGRLVVTNTKKIDMLTGQVTSESRCSKITLPELNVLSSLGLNYTARELMKIRGGDLGASRALDNYLVTQGSVSQNEIERYAKSTLSVQSLKAYLLGLHIRSTL